MRYAVLDIFSTMKLFTKGLGILMSKINLIRPIGQKVKKKKNAPFSTRLKAEFIGSIIQKSITKPDLNLSIV